MADPYWDEKSGVKFKDLLPKVAAYDELISKAPTKPEEIDWTLPGGLDPDDKDSVYEINKEDPMLAAIAPVLIENKVSQPVISALTKAYASAQLAEVKAAKAALQAEGKKLGDKFKERIAGAEAFVALQLGGDDKAKERARAFRNTWVTAEQVEIIEALAKKAAGPNAADPNAPRDPRKLPEDEQERARIWAERNKPKN